MHLKLFAFSIYLKWFPTVALVLFLNVFIYLLFNIRDISNINALAEIHIPEKLIKSTHAQCVAHARNMIVPLHLLGLFLD